MWDCHLSGVTIAADSTVAVAVAPTFPEEEVRQKLVDLLELVSNTFGASTALQNKLSDTLAMTANSMLRNCLLSSMLTMAARSNDVKQ